MNDADAKILLSVMKDRDVAVEEWKKCEKDAKHLRKLWLNEEDLRNKYQIVIARLENFVTIDLRLMISTSAGNKEVVEIYNKLHKILGEHGI